MNEFPGGKSRASGSGPSKPQNGPDDLVRVMRDEKIVDLRREGLSLVQIGAIVDVPKSTVKDAIDRWMTANGPSAEQVEELRQIQGAQLDAYQAKLTRHLMRALRDADGEILYDGNGDDRKPIEVPDVPTGQLWLRLLERRAKLYGLDLERSAGGPIALTRELLHEILSDPAEPIDVESEELSDEPGARS
jgi:hypothetical protein